MFPFCIGSFEQLAGFVECCVHHRRAAGGPECADSADERTPVGGEGGDDVNRRVETEQSRGVFRLQIANAGAHAFNRELDFLACVDVICHAAGGINDKKHGDRILLLARCHFYWEALFQRRVGITTWAERPRAADND